MHTILHSLPAFNAFLNSVNVILLVIGYVHIRRGNAQKHRSYMLVTAVLTVIFLISYLTKTWFLGTTVYGGTGMMRVLYLTILFSHLSLAIVIVPLIPLTLVHGLARRFDQHRRIAKWTLPIWLYVSVTGVTVHFLLRPWY